MTEAAEASYDGAVDEFLGEAQATEEKAPEPKKEQPGKAPAKTEEKAPAPKQEKAPAKAEDAPDEGDDDAETGKPKDGPWRAELAQRGIDTPEVNQYMQEVVQPYITRLEQQGGEISQLFEGDSEAAGIAAGLLNELGENPASAIADLIHLLDVSDEDINTALSALMGDGEQPAPEGEQPAPEGEQPDQENETPEQKWIRERMEAEQQQQESEAYDAFLKTVAEEFGPGFDETLFSMAIAAAGDIEGAMELYPSLAEKYSQPAAKPAPPVMGRSRPGQSPQPVEKTYDGSNQGWEAAFDDVFAEERARRGR